MRLVLWIAIAFLLVLAATFMWQDRLLYFPSTTTVQDVVTDDLQAWPSASSFRGLVAEPNGEGRGTAIVFHGNAGHVGQRAFYVAALAPLGLRVILAEYPGYWPRDGTVGERSM